MNREQNKEFYVGIGHTDGQWKIGDILFLNVEKGRVLAQDGCGKLSGYVYNSSTFPFDLARVVVDNVPLVSANVFNCLARERYLDELTSIPIKIKKVFSDTPHYGDQEINYLVAEIRCKETIEFLADVSKNYLSSIRESFDPDRYLDLGVPRLSEFLTKEVKNRKGLDKETKEDKKTEGVIDYTDYTGLLIGEQKEQKEQQNKKIKSEEINMFDKLNMNKYYGKVTNDMYKYSLVGIAVKTKDGYKAYSSKENQLIDVFDFTFDFENAFYRVPALKDNLKVGDIVVVNNAPRVLVGTSPLTVINYETGTEEKLVNQTNLMGINFYTKIVSMFDMLNLNTNIADGGQNSPNNFLTMMMMSEMFGKDKSNGSGMFGGGFMEMMMMSSLIGGGAGGGAGMNPFANIFGVDNKETKA